MLDAVSVPYDSKEQSILLLEKLIAHTEAPTGTVSLAGIRAAQRIRSKVKRHAGSSEAIQTAEDASTQHGSFAEHFKHVCQLIAAELEMIERTCARHNTPRATDAGSPHR